MHEGSDINNYDYSEPKISARLEAVKLELANQRVVPKCESQELNAAQKISRGNDFRPAEPMSSSMGERKTPSFMNSIGNMPAKFFQEEKKELARDDSPVGQRYSNRV